MGAFRNNPFWCFCGAIPCLKNLITDINVFASLAFLGENLNVNPKTFALRATSSLIKESLKKKTSEAYEKGVFGAPTFVSNNKIFWGQDRIEFVLKEASK